MSRVLLSFLFVSAFIFVPVAAHAEEQLLTLFPKQRAAHQAKVDDTAAKYQARGQDYVDHLYATGGEEPMAELEDLELDLDSDTVPVNVSEVADIIKQDTAK